MEVAAQYTTATARPRLTVVGDGPASYSALPHAVLFSGLSDGAVRLYAVLQSHWWGGRGECTASHATLAAETGKKERTIRALLSELVDAKVVSERRAGRGQAKAYRPCEPQESGRNQPVESGDILPVARPKRQKSASQAAENGQFKRQKSAAPIEEDTGKKILEEERHPTDVVVAADAAPPTPSTDQATILRSLSPEAREILDWHRQCHGRRSPAKLTPASAEVLEAAVADLGVARLRESVKFMAGKIPPVPELSKALTAARSKRRIDEDARQSGRTGAASPPKTGTTSAPVNVKGTY